MEKQLMKRVVVLNNPYDGKITTLNINGDKTVVLEKSRDGVNEYIQDTKDNINFLDYAIQYCLITLKEDSGKLILKINGIEHFRNSYLLYLYLQSLWYLPLPDEKALKFVSDILTGKFSHLEGRLFSNYHDALNSIK